MKRITVAITLGDDVYNAPHELRKIKSSMINAAVGQATEHGLSIISMEAKVGNVRKSK